MRQASLFSGRLSHFFGKTVLQQSRDIRDDPETMSVERRNIIKAYGAEIVLTEGSKGMPGAIAKAKELAEEIENSFIASIIEVAH